MALQHIIGPVTYIKLKSTIICPCLSRSSTQGNSVQHAFSSIHNLHVMYYCNPKNSKNNDESSSAASKVVGNFVSNLFKGGGGGALSSTINSNSSQRGILNITDSNQGPVLCFQPISSNSKEKIQEEEEEEEENEASNENVIIPIKKIGQIVSTNNSSIISSSSDVGIVIYKRAKKQPPGDSSNNDKVELIRFSVLDLDDDYDDDNAVASVDEQEDILSQLSIIVEWDRNRRQNQPNTEEEDDDDDDDDNTSNTKRMGLGQRALKAKYFVEREIEMKTKRKEREERKARYLSDSGGLKYTAVAMANREMS